MKKFIAKHQSYQRGYYVSGKHPSMDIVWVQFGKSFSYTEYANHDPKEGIHFDKNYV